MTTPLREALLIDDSDADNFLHRRVLLRSGLVTTVTVTKDGSEGLAYLQNAETPPDIVFLDINMPIMNGWEFLVEFEKLDIEKRPPIFVAMLSTSLNPADQTRAEDNRSVNAFASKPLTQKRLEEIIQRYTGDQETAD